MSKQRLANTAPRKCCRDLTKLLQPRFFKALGDPKRIAILIRLARCRVPCTVGQVAACCPVDISVVSRHLALLREAGILDAEKRGKEVYYSVRYPGLAATLHAMADAIEACCPPENQEACCPPENQKSRGSRHE
jgi:DNA-binding transcriptional ArsR family regulator